MNDIAVNHGDKSLKRGQQPGLLCRGGVWGDLKLSFADAAEDYGTKVAGLLMLPVAWSPPFAAVPTWLYQRWLKAKRSTNPRALARYGIDLAGIVRTLTTNGTQRLIVRSSATEETLDERGQYVSVIVEAGTNLAEVASTIDDVYKKFSQGEHNASIGIILQS